MTKFEHSGAKLELLGLIESKNQLNFITLSNDLDILNTITNEITITKFNFENVEKLYETYWGSYVKIRYILRLTIETKFRNLTYEQEFIVANPKLDIDTIEKESIEYEIGAKYQLRVFFLLDSNIYSIDGCLKGSVMFGELQIEIKTMHLQLLRRETIVSGATNLEETIVITSFEIMDGTPVTSK